MRNKREVTVTEGWTRRVAPVLFLLALTLVPFATIDADRASATVACDKWASSTGNDINTGLTDASPVRHVAKLLSLLDPGQTGCLRGGETFIEGGGGFQFPLKSNGEVIGGTGGTASNPVNIISEPGKPEATIKAQIELSANAHDIRFENINFRGDSWFGPSLRDGIMRPGGNMLILKGDNLQFHNNDISWPGGICGTVGHIEAYRNIYIGDRADNFVFDGNRIHDCGTDPTIEWQLGDSGSHGLYVENTLGANITNNYFYDNRWRGLQLWPKAEKTTIANNVFDNNASQLNIGSALPDNCYADAALTQYTGKCPWYSSGTTVEKNIFTNPSGFRPDKNESQVFGYYPVATTPSQYSNVVRNNCFYPADTGEQDFNKNFGGYGYTHYGNTFADPGYANRQAKDFTISANSQCAGMGPQSGVQPNTAPTITKVRPAKGSTTHDRTPTIKATISDAETGLQEANIRLFVDGREISINDRGYDPATDVLFHTPDDYRLSYGFHTVKVVANDGELERTKRWSFKVVR